MNYDETINYLFKKLPIYQRDGSIAYKKDIGNITQASKILGQPHLDFRSIHIAGTNGKGSTSHIISSILQEANYKVGLYTSPHLKDFRERIKINGKKISKKRVTEFVNNYKLKFETINMSFFETTVAMAFKYFSDEKVDIAIIETGLGGRLDSTNIINPLISIITNIGMDHTLFLGDTLSKIAHEKAGIIKRNTPVIIGRRQHKCIDIFLDKSKELDCEIIICDNNNKKKETDLKGEYQQENIKTALKSIEILSRYDYAISTENIHNGLNHVVKNTSLLGRWQVIQKNPTIIFDNAHNIDGISQIIKELRGVKYHQLHFIFGTVNDKDINDTLKILPKDALYYFCEANIPRSLNKLTLYKKAKRFNLIGEVFDSVEDAYKEAKSKAKNNDCIFVGGSTFIVAELL